MIEFHPIPKQWNFKNLTGQRFGRLVVIGFVGPGYGNRSMWHCRCDCGGSGVYRGSHLGRRTNSCGCLKLENRANMTHGLSKTKAYVVWSSMIQRCTDKHNSAFHNYGGRGIKVCDRWRYSFENFLADMGHPPAGLTLDRKNNDGDYEPGNCRWATRKEQAINRRTSVWMKTDEGDILGSVVAERNGISSSCFHTRLKRGWAMERAATAPARQIANHRPPRHPTDQPACHQD